MFCNHLNGKCQFDWDYVSVVDCGANTGVHNGFKPEVLKDTPEYIVQRDELGRTTKLFKATATVPLPMDYPVKDMDSWLNIKHLFEFQEERIDEQLIERAKQMQAQGTLVLANIPGGFNIPRNLMGEESLCMAYYTDPELVVDMITTFSDTSFKVLERVTDKLVIDQLSVHEDLAGKSGPLIGPAHVEKFIKPYYHRIWQLVSERGARFFDMDTDGNISPVIDSFIDCGLNSMHPFEPAAGMDIVNVCEKYGQSLVMRGGIGKHTLRQSKADIQRELEYTMQPEMRKGGVVFGLDHRITNGTPLENYRFYVDLGREILGLPPRTPEKKGWSRMAF